jgi:hypothetical protein
MRATITPFIGFDMVKVYKKPYDGSYLQPKHVAANKLIKNYVVSERFALVIW